MSVQQLYEGCRMLFNYKVLYPQTPERVAQVSKINK